jgi:hypothetical protein
MSKLLASHFVLKEISNRDPNGRDDTFGSTEARARNGISIFYIEISIFTFGGFI